MATMFLLAVATGGWTAMPPPPVNQNLGIADTTFNNLQEADCRLCHNQNPPAPYPVDPTYLPDRHKLLVDQPIPPDSDIPIKDADGDGVPDVTYDCLNCHNDVFDSNFGSFVIVDNYRDCTNCHVQYAGESTVHHRATKALEGNCQFCHGSFVDRGLFDTNSDGIAETVNAPWIPIYQPSLVTPWPSHKDIAGTCSITQTQVCEVDGDCPTSETCIPDGVPDPVDLYGTCSVTITQICREGGDCPTGETCNWPDGIPDQSSAGTFAGNCNFCHNNSSGGPGAPTIEDTGPFAPVLVFRNDETHHSTDFFGFTGTQSQPANLCFWCHDFMPPSTNGLSIRTCGNCHGIPSLHNIQLATQPFGFPSDGTVAPGMETCWSGHAGNQIDCNGCHGFANLLSRSSGNQNPCLGHTVFNQMGESECRYCHNQNPPAPYPVDPTYLPDRHHLKVGQPILPYSEISKTDADGDGAPDTTYDCLNCHNIVWNPNFGSFVIVDNYRDCTNCHVKVAGDPLLAFFDESVADGTLEGDGPGNSADGRLNALRNILEMASDLINIGEIEDACEQLMVAKRKCDGESPPPDFVTGNAAEDLHNMILELMEAIGCE